MSTGLVQRYEALLAGRAIEPDPAQASAVAALDRLAAALEAWRPARGWSLAGLFANRSEPPRGLYIHGPVGRGKTMLMDLFFEASRFRPKRRIHFHEFMAEVHEGIAEARKSVDGDPIPQVARRIADSAGLLCFDELHVTDIADAMILGRLFKALLERKVVVVATSNAHPADLYRNGLNRQLFLPFVELLLERLDVLELKAAKDFRLEKLAGQPLYFSPLGPEARSSMRAMFQRLTGLAHGAPATIDVKGRSLVVPEAAHGVARFAFADLCERPLGTLDFLHIAHAFHTVLIEDVPCLDPERRAEARRFINLIDTLYDNRIGLVVSAAAEPGGLYPEGKEAYLFERTESRLIEMRSEAYLAERDRRSEITVVAGSAKSHPPG